MTLDQLGLIVQFVIWTCASTALLCIAWLAAAACCVIVRRWRQVRTPTQPSRIICPCCTGLDSDDCTCREDCGVTQCQAADVGDGCPWCETRECIDSSQCNCAVPCGSWLCIVKEDERA